MDESAISQAQGGDGLGGRENFSPFRPPNEEQVFITRETEKRRKKESKEAAKHLKIWDKKTATSRMPLKRVKDGDIKPTQNEENVYNFNSSQRGFISAAMHIARSRVQFPRESRPQNISEFVDQKKEMFLVELSYNTVKDEIKDLDLKKNRKAYALKDSHDQLEKDSDKLIKFIETDNRTTSDRNKDAELAMQERKAAEARIKNIETKIQNVKSEMDKNVDQLQHLEDLKTFLFKIFATDIQNPRWVEQQEMSRSHKLESIKRDWIERSKFQKDTLDEDEMLIQDFIKPKAGEPSSSKLKNLESKSGEKQLSASKQNFNKNQSVKGQNKKERDLEARFEQLLDLDLIDVPDDFYEDEILYTHPDQFYERLAVMEDAALKNVLDTQEFEEGMERKLQFEKQIRQEIGGEILIQEGVQEDLLNEIARAQKELTEMRRISQMSLGNQGDGGNKNKKKNDKHDEEDEVNIDHLNSLIQNEIEDLYKVFGDNDSAIEAKSSLDILMEIESRFMNLTETIQYIGKVAPGNADIIRQLEQKRRNLRREENLVEIKQQAILKAEHDKKQLEDRQKRQSKPVGKPRMFRSQKQNVRQKVVQKVIDEDTLDQYTYLGFDLSTLDNNNESGGATKTNQ